MTSAARLVLEDCEEALQELIDCEVDFGTGIGISSIRRRRWLAVVALLRVVGHVLKNVDGESSPLLENIIRLKWEAVNETKPEPSIFWSFIEDERNTVIKQYRFRSYLGASTNLACCSITYRTASGITSTINRHSPGGTEIWILADGPFAGHNDIEVVTEAIQWWRAYLEEIETKFTLATA